MHYPTFLSFSKLFKFIEEKSKHKQYVHILSLVLLLTTCCFSAPQVIMFFFEKKLSPAWDTILLKSKDLTNNLKHIEPYSWQAKKVFRLTIPVLMKVFKLTPTIVIIFQIITGYLTYFYAYKLSYRIFKDSIASTLLVTSFAFLYFGKACFFEYYYTWFDGFSYFFLIMAMYSRKFYSIFLFSMLAAWNDERAFIALIMVLIFHSFETKQSNKITFKDLLPLNLKIRSIIFSIVTYLITRLILTFIYDMHTPKEGANLSVFINKTYKFIPFGLITFFEGFVILILFAFYIQFKNKDYLRFSLVFFPLILITTLSFFVTDITRSGSFAFPIIFISSLYIKKILNKKNIYQILFLCLFVTYLFPPIFICADWDINLMISKNFFTFLFDFF